MSLYLNSWVAVNLNDPTGAKAQSVSIALTTYANLSNSVKFFYTTLTSASSSDSYAFYS